MIDNIDIETLYSKIGNRIDLIGSYLEDNSLPKMMRSCRLKPYTIFSTGFQTKFIFEPHWVDEFGNSLKIENKNIKIIMNDTQVTKNTQISTDLFFGNAINTVAKNSQCVMIITGKKCYIIAFYGKDEYLRVFFHNKKIAQISPLLLGINTLRELFKTIIKVPQPVIDSNKLDLLLKFDILSCMVCWQPLGWKDHVKEI